jgi:hypothetical protein
MAEVTILVKMWSVVMKTLSLSALTALGLLAGAPVHAVPLFGQTPVVTVTVSRLQSQAQLAANLSQQGYSHVVLSAVTPNVTDPHPELNPGETASPATTPVRNGWNGVADKDGQTVQVYVTGL